MKIKICGLTRPIEAAYLNEASVDYAGFVFYEKSKRNITVNQAEEIMKELNPDIKKVAVMVSPDENMINMLQKSSFDILQIHKELTKEVLSVITLPVWYAVNISDEDEYEEKMQFIDNLPDDLKKKITGIVVDAPSFGSGKPFNWRKSRRLMKAGAQSPPNNNDRLFILAGGLNKDNVKEGIELFDPDIVDCSSSVEGKEGKDRDLVINFSKAVKNI